MIINRLMYKKGFSLIELLVVIAIISTLIGIALPNYLAARGRAKDARRKEELQQLKSALQLYYNDFRKYPPAGNGAGKFNYIAGCGASGTTLCPGSCTVDFAAGGAGCDTVYMTKLPSELGSSMFYYEVASGDDFCAKVTLDNASDADIAASQTRCSTKCSVSGADYAVCSD